MSADRTHIVLICSRLDLPGGIERAICNLANLLAANHYEVTILQTDIETGRFYPLSGSVKLVDQVFSFGITEAGNVISRKLRLLSDVISLRKTLKKLKPDYIIATEYPFAVTAVLAGASGYAKIISWEHHHKEELKKNLFWKKLADLVYPRLDAVICLNEDERKLWAVINKNTFVIPNFIDGHVKQDTRKENQLLTVARLTHVKGTDLLLKIALAVLKDNSVWKWIIKGEGDMENMAGEFIKENHLQDQLIIEKPVNSDIDLLYNNASLYVMTSRNECFPMVLLEAMSKGIPCVSFDCETGPRHIIEQGKNGLLVEPGNIEKMIASIKKLIADYELQKEMGENAIQSVQRFSPGNIYPLWKKLFNDDLKN